MGHGQNRSDDRWRGLYYVCGLRFFTNANIIIVCNTMYFANACWPNTNTITSWFQELPLASRYTGAEIITFPRLNRMSWQRVITAHSRAAK